MTTGDSLATPETLRDWLQSNLDLELPPARAGLEPAPFRYLAHAAFDSPGPADSVVWASRGGGKTFLGAVATALELLHKPGITIRILGGSLEQAARMHHHLRRLFERRRLACELDGPVSARRIRLTSGSTAELLAQSQTSVRGTRVHRLRCDEVELFDPDVWEAAQLTTRSGQCARGFVRAGIDCLSTMHVPGGLMSRLVQEGQEGRRRLFRWGLVDVLEHCERTCQGEGADCPLSPECSGRAREKHHAGHVGVDDAIAMKARVSLATWESEMLCRRPVRRDAVFPEFTPDHVVDGAPWDAAGPLTWLAGMDFGFRAPTVVLWAALDPADVLWVVDERNVAGAILGEHVQAIAASPWPALAWIGVDPAGAAADPQTGLASVKVLRDAGLTVRYRASRVVPGLELIRARLRAASGGPPRLLIHRRCVKLIESMERYRFPPNPQATEPLKDGADHAVDALRYLVVNLDQPYQTKTKLW